MMLDIGQIQIHKEKDILYVYYAQQYSMILCFFSFNFVHRDINIVYPWPCLLEKMQSLISMPMCLQTRHISWNKDIFELN